MSPQTRLVIAILALMAVLVVGTAGYRVIEAENHPSLLDAAYMTVITVTTVGFTDHVWELSDAGRIWTIGVIVFGIGTVSVAFTSLIAVVVSGELRSIREKKKMKSTLRQMRNHVIVCGYGRMGTLIIGDLNARGIPAAVVEVQPDAREHLQERGIPYVIGDATEDETLDEAGLDHARSLVTLLPHDADNIYVTLTAHTIRPELRVIARAEQPATEAKLIRAGAARVICPQVIGASRIVNVLTRPNVVDFVDIANKGVDLEMDEYIISAHSPLVGKALRDSRLRERMGAIVVAVKRSDGETLYNPEPDAVFQADDTLIVIGPAGVSSQIEA